MEKNIKIGEAKSLKQKKNGKVVRMLNILEETSIFDLININFNLLKAYSICEIMQYFLVDFLSCLPNPKFEIDFCDGAADLGRPGLLPRHRQALGLLQLAHPLARLPQVTGPQEEGRRHSSSPRLAPAQTTNTLLIQLLHWLSSGLWSDQ